MDEFRIDQELFRSIPADLMLRYGFVPLRREGTALFVPVNPAADPEGRTIAPALARVHRFAAANGVL